jgi:predicted nucleotidyltransferase
MEQRIRDILTELREHFQRLYGPRLVKMILYGSQARGDAVEGSDIDVLVVLRGQVDVWVEIQRSSEFICDLSLGHGILVSRAFVDAERYARERSPFLLNVRREGVPV